METVIDLLRAMQLNMLEVGAAGLFIFLTGYLVGIKKVKELKNEVHELQRDVLELNEELLFGIPVIATEAPVIGFKHDNLKTKIAK